MNGSQQQKVHETKNVFEKLTMTSVGYLPDSFKVDLDQDDDPADVVGLMPNVDAMAMAAESSPVPIAKQTGPICIQPTAPYDVGPYQVCSTQQPQMSMTPNTTAVYPNVVTLVAVPSNLTPICDSVGEPPMQVPDLHQQNVNIQETYEVLEDDGGRKDAPHQSVICSVNEFLKTGRRRGTVEMKEAPVVDDNSEVAGKLKRLEVRTLFVDFDRRREDLKALQQQFPSMSTRQLDSLYMKVGCDKERAIEALNEKVEEEERQRAKALEEWKKNFDKRKIIKRVGGKNVYPPVIKRAKFEDGSGDELSGDDKTIEVPKPTPPPMNLMYPNQRIPSDVRVYKKFFRRVEPSDTGSRINAFMERNVVEYAAADSEEQARPVRVRNHVRHDESTCTGRSASHGMSSETSNEGFSPQPSAAKATEPPSSSADPSMSVEADSVKHELSHDSISTNDKVMEESKSVSLLGLDDDDDDAGNIIDSSEDCGRVEECDEDRLSTTSSNTRASNSSGGGAGGANKFFRNKVSTAAALHKRAYLSRELNQAWSTGNKRQLPHNPVLEMGGNSPAVGNTTPLSAGRGRSRARVWTAASDATPVFSGKSRGNVMPPFSSSPLKIPTESPSTLQNTSTPTQGRQIISTEQIGDRLTVLDFFNTAESEDLAGIPSCSRKKADMIISMRPFLSMKDLAARFDRQRPLSSSLIGNCKELLQLRANVNRLLSKCQKISSTLMPRVSSLISQGKIYSADSGDSLPSWEQPSLLNKELSLKPYQIIGVKWLKLLHSLNLNGILADEMGLGKTVQTIAFLASLMETGDKGPHLVIVPSTTLENWCREFDVWCPSLRVLLYYGSFEERKAMRKEVYESGKNDFNIILTTYSVATNSIEDRTMMKRLDLHYGVFDEAHMLKNMTSQRYRYLMTFKIQRRLLLTGTPLQNNLLELMSLLSFVMPNLFGQRETSEVLKKLFQSCSRVRDDTGKPESNNGDVQTPSYEKERILQAKSLLRPFILRRLKSHVLSQLPPKLDVVERVALPPVQRLHYVDMITEMRDQLRRDESGDRVSVGMLLQLRKAANHTLLHRRRFTNDMLRDMARTLKKKEPGHKKAKEQLIYEDLCALNDFEIHKICELYKDYIGPYALPKEDIISSSGKLMYLDAALPTMLSAGDRVLLFSQFVLVLDVIEEFLRLRGYRFVRMDGTTRVVDRQDLIDKFQTDPDVFIFLLSTRCGGLGINLTAANVVILHDIDYNPHNDRQAEDRCHRVGQARDVRVIRLLAANTVEEGMYRLACDKLRLEEDITGDFITPTTIVKHEPEDEEEEDESEEQVGGTSQKRSLASLSKAVEAREDSGADLSGTELKEVKELLREALYPQAERDSKSDYGSSVVSGSQPSDSEPAKKCDVTVSNQKSTNSVVESSQVSEEVREESPREEKSEKKVVPEPSAQSSNALMSESEIVSSATEESKEKMDVSKPVDEPAQTKVAPTDSTEASKNNGGQFVSSDVESCKDGTGEATSAGPQENVERPDSHPEVDQHSTEHNSDIPEQRPSVQVQDNANTIEQSSESCISADGGINSTTSEETVPKDNFCTTQMSTNVESTPSDMEVDKPESTTVDDTTNTSSNINRGEDEQIDQVNQDKQMLETAADEVCSIDSTNDKVSNPSEISEDTRPLIISEQRSSTDSEEIDVVGET